MQSADWQTEQCNMEGNGKQQNLTGHSILTEIFISKSEMKISTIKICQAFEISTLTVHL